MPEVSHVSVPLWAVCLVLTGFAAQTLALLMLWMSRRSARPLTLERVEAILDEAEADCPNIELTGDFRQTPYIRALDAQRVYWKNAFIAFVKRGL